MASQENDWIEWAGGECPVPVDTRVEARWYADGTFLTDIGAARSFVWWNNGKPRDPMSGDIVAYRVVSA